MTEVSGNFNVAYSNWTEKLVEVLAGNLSRTGAFDSVFDSPTILVPNWNLSRYLKFELSQRFGLASDYFSTVEEMLGDAAEGDVEFLDNPTLQSAILNILRNDEFLESQNLEDVNRYLGHTQDGNNGSQTARNVKLYQLSRQLARNFRQYSHSRVDMIETWRSTENYYSTSEHYQANERWQRYIWDRLFDEDGQLSADSDDEVPSSLYLLPEYFRQVDTHKLDLPEQIHIFGISHFAPVYGRIFERMAEQTSFYFYVLNPCREFWEDVIYDEQEEILDDLHSRRDLAEDLSSDSLSLDPETSSDSPFALRAWGRAGRDLIHMLNTLSGYHFSEHWMDPRGTNGETTLLEQFQHDVLTYQTPDEDPERWSSDRSVQFLACRNKRREVEAVADQIWSLVMQENGTHEESLSFEDIAVVVNPRKRQEYQSRIETVFDKVHEIPFNEIDITRSERSRLMESIESLLSLPTEPVQRENFLTILTHPNFGYIGDQIDKEQLKQWVDNLGIFHGGDSSDHDSTYIDRDIFNWDQGLRRLVLGYFMDEKRHTDERQRFTAENGKYRPETVSETDTQSVGSFVESTRRLIATARSVRGEERSLTEWFEWMAEFIRTNLEPSESQEAEFTSYLDKLSTLAEIETTPDSVEYDLALQFALDELGKLESRPGNYLASGVVVSSFLPQRPIPFECVFMLGMTEEDFPASSPRSPIDLHTEQWQEGDLWDRDRERYMFFETLLSIRRRVYLSWVAQDPVTGEAIEPSSVLREFQQILQGYLGTDQVDELIVQHHLRRSHPRYFDPSDQTSHTTSETGENQDGRPAREPTFNPEAIAEARVKRIREQILEREDWSSNRELATRGVSGDIEELLRSVDRPEAEEVDPDPEVDRTPKQLKISALRKYFRSPLQAWATHGLGLTEENEETIIDKNTEPFETDHLWGTVLPRNSYETAVLKEGCVPGGETIDSIYREEMVALQEEGNAPAGLFGEVQDTKHRDLLQYWHDAMAEDSPGELTRFRFGSSGTVENVQTETPYQISIPGLGEGEEVVDLVGDTELYEPESNTFYTLATNTKTYKFLRGFLSGVVLMGTGMIEEHEFRVIMIGSDESEERIFSWNHPLSPGEYLKERVAELCTGPHDYRLPIDVCEQFLDPSSSTDKSFHLRVREVDAKDRQSTQDEYGPLKSVEDYPTRGYTREGSADQFVRQTLRNRLGPFWVGYFEQSWDEIVSGDQE